MKCMKIWNQQYYEKNKLKLALGKKKIKLIEDVNPEWRDLYNQII